MIVRACRDSARSNHPGFSQSIGCRDMQQVPQFDEQQDDTGEASGQRGPRSASLSVPEPFGDPLGVQGKLTFHAATPNLTGAVGSQLWEQHRRHGIEDLHHLLRFEVGVRVVGQAGDV